MISLLPIQVLSIVILVNQNVCAVDLASETKATTNDAKKITNPYLQHLFNTYGAHGTISFEVCKQHFWQRFQRIFI